MKKREYYLSDLYKSVHYSGLMKIFTNNYHSDLEKLWRRDHFFDKVFEIGGGSGEHFPWVDHDFNEYISLDVVQQESGIQDKRHKMILGDARLVPFPDDYFDRAISTCVLHHISDPHDALLELRRITKNGGRIDLYIPHDPGIVYRALRHLTSHKKQSKVSSNPMMEVKYLWSQEHPNHFPGLRFSLLKIFEADEIREFRRPIPFFSWNFNLYSIFRIKIQK